MNIDKVETGQHTATVTIHLEPEDYKGPVQEELKKQAKKAALPGFRPGKVPLGVVRKMVGMSVLVEQVSQLINQELNRYIEEEKLEILGDPLPTSQKTDEDFDIYCEQALDFSFDIGLAPDFELVYKLKKKPVHYQIAVDDKMLNEEIENQRDRFGEVTNPEEAAEGDILYGKLYEVDAEGAPLEDGFEKMVAFNPMRIDNKKFFKPLMGTKLEDELELDVFKIAKKDEQVAEVLFMEVDELKALKKKALRFRLQKINRVEKAELNEEFFQKAATSNRWEDAESVQDEATFRERLKEELGKQMEESAKWYYRNKIQEGLMDAHPMDLPDEFLKRWLLTSRENYTEERVEQEYEEFEQSVKWSLVVSKIMEKEEIKVEEEELIEAVRESVKRNMGNLDPELEEQYVQYSLQNQEMLDMQFRRLRDDKLYGFLEAQFPGKSEKITATDFIKLTKK